MITDHLPYQDKPDPWSSHTVIADWVKTMPPDAQILDVGTASGTLARMCASTGQHWHGLEPVAAWGEIARPFYERFFIGGIEIAPDEFLSGADFVILGDILEHLANPTDVLNRLVELQEPGTQFAISVPNIANLYVRIKLLFGSFDYVDRGILDRTHLRFFTRKSFIEMLTSCGLEIIKMRVTPMPLNLIHPFFANNPLGKFLHSALAKVSLGWPTMLGYQLIALAQKPSVKDAANET